MKFVNKLIKEPESEPLSLSEWLLGHVLGPLGWLFVNKGRESNVAEAEDYGEWGDADKEEFKRLMDTKRGH
jgi:hypothetical protein